MELQRIIDIARKDDAAAVGRPVRLVVVAGPGGQLYRDVGVDVLAPEAAGHRVDERRAVR